MISLSLLTKPLRLGREGTGKHHFSNTARFYLTNDSSYKGFMLHKQKNKSEKKKEKKEKEESPCLPFSSTFSLLLFCWRIKFSRGHVAVVESFCFYVPSSTSLILADNAQTSTARLRSDLPLISLMTVITAYLMPEIS